MRETRNEEGRGAESVSPTLGGSGGPDDTGADCPPRSQEKGDRALCETPNRLEKCRKVKKHDYSPSLGN